jgi:hypothetical protein
MEFEMVDMIGWLLIILFVLVIISLILGVLKLIYDLIQEWFF